MIVTVCLLHSGADGSATPLWHPSRWGAGLPHAAVPMARL